MFLYGITPVLLTEEIWAADLGLLTLLYADDAAFDGSERSSAHLLNLPMERGAEWGYFSEPDKLLFIAKMPEH